MIRFHPRPGTILLCDYDTGFKPPEMVKVRPAIVITPRLRNRDGLCTVVPLSQTAPNPVQDYHARLVFERPLPGRWGAPEHWVKADMLATVSYERLHLIGLGRDHEGKRSYLNIQVKPEQLKQIRVCVLHALGLSALTQYV